ncbi:MFS transporter [Klebsiella sp. BIGb0407]|uniref:MFS transporter n=1 Tax=Klebsiella sp. BIGb0407 TaxID=2940603 RepID=UPI002167973E|nr:MFS transporter [Klebsiella sp. BIGb0407]MCS3433639.1 MFS family permease [Klebsiella sp. BIGb0407]
MINAYRALFAAPGSLSFTFAGLLARLPLPMTGIGLITLISQLQQSYALAGAVSASFVLTYALVSPQLSRWVDTHGQRRVLPWASLISVTGMILILITSKLQYYYGLLFIGAILTGFMPSMSAMIRARWVALYRDQPQLQTAYSLETVFDEVTFIIGPPLAVGLAVLLFPQAGILTAAVLLLLGALAMVLLKETEPQLIPASHTGQAGKSVIRLAAVQRLTLLMIALGTIVGTVDIVSVAFARAIEQPVAASLVLSAYACGSCLAGLLFGSKQFSLSLPQQLLLGGSTIALTTLPLLWVGSLYSLMFWIFWAGVTFAPTMIIAMSLVERAVPEYSITEGMTWLLAGLNIGVALGAALSGYFIDKNGLQSGFILACVGGGSVLVLALWDFLKPESRG